MGTESPHILQGDGYAKGILRLRQRIINQVPAVLERDAIARLRGSDQIALVDELALRRVVAELNVGPDFLVQQRGAGVQPDLTAPGRGGGLRRRRRLAE